MILLPSYILVLDLTHFYEQNNVKLCYRRRCALHLHGIVGLEKSLTKKIQRHNNAILNTSIRFNTFACVFCISMVS